MPPTMLERRPAHVGFYTCRKACSQHLTPLHYLSKLNAVNNPYKLTLHIPLHSCVHSERKKNDGKNQSTFHLLSASSNYLVKVFTMRAAILNRAASIPTGTNISGFWPRSPAAGHDAGVSLYRRSRSYKMPLDVREMWNLSSSEGKLNPLRRVRSETDLIRSAYSAPLNSSKERWLPPALLASAKEDDLDSGVLKWVSAEVVVVKEDEEVEYADGSGRGKGKGSKRMGGSFGDGGNGENNGKRMIDNYYQELLRADPGNPLLLRNYGRFLHEVERDLKKAEDYYGRAILASPGDGELLSLYANLIWESHRDCKSAEAYHERAVEASPDDCYVLGSYAHFLWDAEDEEEEHGMVGSSSPFVEAL